MAENRVFLSFGRHERYGHDTAILREDMLVAYATGCQLRQILPPCVTVYHSPLARAVETARFEALGLKCDNLIETEALEEGATKFTTQRFLNQLLQNTDDSVQYYHFVTHMPVVDRLGLAMLDAGDVCLLSAADWQQMMAENFETQVIKAPRMLLELWQSIGYTPDSLESLSPDEIYRLLENMADK